MRSPTAYWMLDAGRTRREIMRSLRPSAAGNKVEARLAIARAMMRAGRPI